MPARQQEAKPSKDSRLLDGKVDDIVAKVIPGKWLPMSFVIAAVAAFIFFIIMLIAFISGPTLEQATKDAIAETNKAKEAAIAKTNKAKEAEVARRIEAEKKASEAEKKARETERKARAATAELPRKDKLLERAKKEKEDAEKDLAKIKQLLTDERNAKAKAVKSLNAASRDRTVYLKAKTSLAADLTKMTNDRDAWRVKYDELRKVKDEGAKIADRARDAFKDIMETANKVEDLGKRLEALKRLGEARGAELAGTEYATRLDREIEGLRRKARGEAKGTYAAAMRKYKMATGFEAQIAVLRRAADDLADTDYEDDVDKLIKRIETENKEKVARAIYDEAMKRLKTTPKDFEGNLAALRDAAGRTEGTRYKAILEKHVAARAKTLADDIARGAYEGLAAAIKKGRTNFDENIATGEAALAKAKGSRYEAKVQALLNSQRSEKTRAAGLKAYNTAVAKVKSSKDRDANIAALEELKAAAAGSRYEASIDKLLNREKILKDRGR